VTDDGLVLVIGAICACSLVTSVSAQRPPSAPAPLVPAEARALIVRVDSRFPQQDSRFEPPTSFSAGIVVGANEHSVYIATARHAAYRGDTAAAVLSVVFPPPYDAIVEAALHPAQDKELDFAVVVIPRSPLPAIEAALASFDRVGDVRFLGFGAAVVAVGCPLSECWKWAATPDRIVFASNERILFDTQKAVLGASGGGLFNERWELVAMTVEHEGTIGRANTIAPVLERLRALSVPTGLRAPAIPRAGYPTVLTMSLLLPASSGSRQTGESRLPSGRISVVRRRLSPLSWHASMTRLAPRDLAVTAGMLGASTALSAGRLSVQPFAEVGLGRIEGRFDAGGVEVFQADGTLQHSPRWQQVRADGIGVGLGAAIQLVVLPHVMLDLLGGRWDFPSPPGAPRLPDLFVGAGFRFGR
jgi:hypothetical protein